MTKTLRPIARAPALIRLDGRLILALLRLGLPLGPMVQLTVTGRKSGQPRTMPVGLFEHAGRRFLFSTFGEVNWVRNLRAAGRAVITCRRRPERVAALELPPEAAGPVFQAVFVPYLAAPFTRTIARAWYGITAQSSPSDFVNTARHHPAFELFAEGTTSGSLAR
jgi:deazaflavin-dependent oxidoreductase (nitroreductase family)